MCLFSDECVEWFYWTRILFGGKLSGERTSSCDKIKKETNEKKTVIRMIHHRSQHFVLLLWQSELELELDFITLFETMLAQMLPFHADKVYIVHTHRTTVQIIKCIYFCIPFVLVLFYCGNFRLLLHQYEIVNNHTLGLDADAEQMWDLWMDCPLQYSRCTRFSLL